MPTITIPDIPQAVTGSSVYINDTTPTAELASFNVEAGKRYKLQVLAHAEADSAGIDLCIGNDESTASWSLNTPSQATVAQVPQGSAFNQPTEVSRVFSTVDRSGGSLVSTDAEAFTYNNADVAINAVYDVYTDGTLCVTAKRAGGYATNLNIYRYSVTLSEVSATGLVMPIPSGD